LRTAISQPVARAAATQAMTANKCTGLNPSIKATIDRRAAIMSVGKSPNSRGLFNPHSLSPHDFTNVRLQSCRPAIGWVSPLQATLPSVVASVSIRPASCRSLRRSSVRTSIENRSVQKRSAAATSLAGCSPGSCSVALHQFIQQCLCLFQNRRVEAFGEPAIPKFNSSHRQLVEIAQEYGHDRAL
jgi:hypothetical protein